MKQISWLKKSADRTTVIGCLNIMVPTPDEIQKLPYTGTGWTLQSVHELVVDAAKVKAAQQFVSILKNSDRRTAENTVADWVPNVTYKIDVQKTAENIAAKKIRENAIAMAEKLKAKGMDVDMVRDLMSDTPDLEGVLMAVGLVEDVMDEEVEE